jgi:hypothetical protein
LIWLFTLIIHFVSVLIESGRFDKTLAARAQAEEERIIEVVLQRLSAAEKRKRSTTHLEEQNMIEGDEEPVSFIAAEKQQYITR